MPSSSISIAISLSRRPKPFGYRLCGFGSSDRPASVWLTIWFGIGSQSAGDSQLDGSPTDAFVFLVLLVAAIAVLYRRGRRTVASLGASIPLVVYFSYCLLSVIWAPYPEVAFKRWIKDVGDLAMVLVVVTDADPIAALRRLFSRVGFILLPASVLLIKYSDLGHQIDPWGDFFNTGVTTNKNTLGMITFVLSLGTVWSVCTLLRARLGRTRNRNYYPKYPACLWNRPSDDGTLGHLRCLPDAWRHIDPRHRFARNQKSPGCGPCSGSDASAYRATHYAFWRRRGRSACAG